MKRPPIFALLLAWALVVWGMASFALAQRVSGPDDADGRALRRTPIVRAVERVKSATVNITTRQQVSRRANPFRRGDPFFEDFFGMFMDPRPRTAQSLGTGVIIGPEHFVITNEHVLASATEIVVTLLDGREFEGELIGADPETDLAVVALNTDEALPAATLGSSEDLMIGETVVAIGNPFGLGHTVTTGVLSAVNRSIRAERGEYHGFLQTDASINPGNSGGPLVNLNGEVIGINTAIFREAEGIGFAIPIDRVRRITDDLIQHGELIPVWLGLRLQELTPRLRDGLEVQARRGALVSHVFESSPAARADLQRGDVLVELEGTRIQRPRNYFEILRGLTEGERTQLRFERGGAERELELVAERFPEGRADDLARILIGIDIDADEPPSQSLGLRVRGVAKGSPAQRVGIRPGDRILKVDQEKIVDREAFRRAVTQLRGRRRVLLLVQRGQRGYHVTLGIS